MSTSHRKARKRSRAQFVRTQKSPTRPHLSSRVERGLGLISSAENLARVIARPSR